MAAISIPTYVDLLLPTLKALDQLGGSGTNGEIDEAVSEMMGLSDAQLSVAFPSEARQKGSKVAHRLAWARSYLKKLGAVNNSERGVWTVEPTARTYLDTDPTEGANALRAADAEMRRQDRIARLATGAIKSSDTEVDGAAESDIDEEPPGEMEAAYDWTDRLLRALLAISPAAFERLTQRLLREAGFKNVEVTGKSGDGGLDGVGVYRPSLISFPIFFQCKRFKDTVGPGMVRDFRGAMAGRGEKGLLITTGTFTAEAKKEAVRDGAPPVELIDGRDLCGLLKEFNVGVTTKLIETVEIDEGFFADL